jgi:hypothetical protein
MPNISEERLKELLYCELALSRINSKSYPPVNDEFTVDQLFKLEIAEDIAYNVNEIWASIDDEYIISNYGRVKENKAAIYLRHTPSLKLLRSTSGQMYFVTKKGEQIFVGFMVATKFLPNPECKEWILFKDNNFKNCKADNLEWTS